MNTPPPILAPRRPVPVKSADNRAALMRKLQAITRAYAPESSVYIRVR